MAKEKLEVIKESDITNNCPECFNQELTLTFYQKHKYSRLYHRTTSDVTHEVKCKTCGSSIYPVKWTEDIERVFGYYKKMVKPAPSSLKFTSLFFILILVSIALIGTLIYLFYTGMLTF